jgi:hypothetical protein
MAISLSFYGPLSCAGRLVRTGICVKWPMLAAKKGRIEEVDAGPTGTGQANSPEVRRFR